MSLQSNLKLQTSNVARLWPWLAAVLSGILLTLCFAPWNQGWLCWFALTPLIAALLTPGGWMRRVALGYVTGLVFFCATFFWLSTTLSELYANPWLLALTPLLGSFLALYFAFWAWFVGAVVFSGGGVPRFTRSLGNLGLAAAGAGAWILHEWVRERLFGGFGWNPLGVALHRDLPMIQIAEFTGVPGLSFLVIFTNLMAVIIVRRIVGEIGPVFLKRVRWEFSATMALIAAVFAFGVRALLRAEHGSIVPLHIVAVQPNIPQTEKFDPAAEERTLARLEQLTTLATLTPPGQPGPQLVIWPESAVPRGMFASQEMYRFVQRQAQRGDFGLLLGTVDFDPQRGEDYNTAALLTNRGEQHQSYRKIHLVPFGEYLPLRLIFGGFVGQLVPSDFTAGVEHTLLALPNAPVKIGALVCFEDTLGDLTRQFVARGAQVLVNITNDGWFAQSPAAEQHLANAALRAVENRRPLIRCGNTGVTCAISATGHIERSLPPFTQGFAAHKISVPTQGRLTFYTRHGDWLCAVAAVIVLATLARTFVRHRRQFVRGDGVDTSRVH